MHRLEIERALDAWQSVAHEISRSVDALSLDDRRRLIHLRSDMSARFGELSGALDRAGAAQWEPAILDLLREARQRASAVRRLIALHQTRWPTVLIPDDPDAYLADSKRLRTDRDAFGQWLRTALMPRL